MDLRRLRRVRDICPLLHPAHASITASSWVAPIAAHHRPVASFQNGHSIALVANRLITWHRSFTRDCAAPPAFDPPSFLYIHEWVPDAQPARHARSRWYSFGFSQKQGVAFLPTDAREITRGWSAQARRHLKIFRHSGTTQRLGTIGDYVETSAQSHLSEDIVQHTIDQATTVREIHPKDLDVLVSEDEHGVVLGVFIVAHCDEVRQSYYIGGCYTAAGAAVHAITGLVWWWFERSVARGFLSVNFGDMCGPRVLALDPTVGYSNFKTHFGVHRVWRPQTLWKIRVRLRVFAAARQLDDVVIH